MGQTQRASSFMLDLTDCLSNTVLVFIIASRREKRRRDDLNAFFYNSHLA
jgi:hypothetical protein